MKLALSISMLVSVALAAEVTPLAMPEGDPLPQAIGGDDFRYRYANHWDDLRVEAFSVNPVGHPNAAEPVITSGPSGDQQALRFSPSATMTAATEYQMPHSWLSNTVVYPHIHVEPTTAGTGGVVIVIAYSWANIGEIRPASTVITNTYVITTTQAWLHLLWNMPSNGISGTNKVYSSILDFTFSRIGGAAADTYSGSLDVKSVDCHYLDRGSPIEWTP